MDYDSFEEAIRNMKAKCYVKTKYGFRVQIKESGKKFCLGTFKTEQESAKNVTKYRVDKYKNEVSKYEKEIHNCKVLFGKYLIYQSGNIFNLYGEIIKGETSNSGYQRASLQTEDGIKKYCIHRLILSTFFPIDNMEEKQVNHIDGCKLNNNLSNLEWCTPKQNMSHAWRIGLLTPKKGEECITHKLTEEQVRFIKKNFMSRDKEFGEYSLAKKFNVSHSTIRDIICNKTWREIKI